MIIQLLPNFCANKNQTFLERNEEVTQKQCTNNVLQHNTHKRQDLLQNIWWTKALYEGIFSWFCWFVFYFIKELVFIRFPSMKTLLFIKHRCLAVPAIWLDDSHSNVLLAEPEEALSVKIQKGGEVILLYKEAPVMGRDEHLVAPKTDLH